jgi:hypothetical protein
MKAKRKGKRNIIILAVVGCVVLLLIGAAGMGQGQCHNLAGTWIGTNSNGHMLVITVTPTGHSQFASSADDTADPTFGGLFPEAVTKTLLRGDYIRTGCNTYDFSYLAYGLGAPLEGEGVYQVVYKIVVSGEIIQTDMDTIEGPAFTAAIYTPDQDPFGNEPPLYGCYPVSGTFKRMPVVPSCELPPEEPQEPEG